MWYGFGSMWLLGPLMMVAFWGGLILLVVWAMRASRPVPPAETAVEILRRRLASGEITQEQYDQARRALQG